MDIGFIFLLLCSAFVGYSIGCSGNKLNEWLSFMPVLFHHWIYGFFLMFVGFYFKACSWSFFVFAFGLGLFVSDIRDFFNLKFIHTKKMRKQKKKFWDFD